MKSIYDMKLHETLNVDVLTTVTRVPGGWVYIMDNVYGATSVCVPYHNEFHGN